jgi:hypothetical protein
MKNNPMREYTREELLALTPAKYLAKGFVDGRGRPKPELQSEYATAAATQLLAGQLSPQELVFTFEALRQSLPLHSGAPPKRIKAALDEALETVRGLIRQPNNPALDKWINACAAAVKKPADIDAFLAHLQAVLRLYSVFVVSLST